MDCSPPGSSVHGIFQERILECVAIPFSRDLPDLGIKPGSPTVPVDSLPTEPPGKHRTTLQGALVKDHPEVKFFNADISRILRKLVCFVL